MVVRVCIVSLPYTSGRPLIILSSASPLAKINVSTPYAYGRYLESCYDPLLHIKHAMSGLPQNVAAHDSLAARHKITLTSISTSS